MLAVGRDMSNARTMLDDDQSASVHNRYSKRQSVLDFQSVKINELELFDFLLGSFLEASTEAKTGCEISTFPYSHVHRKPYYDESSLSPQEKIEKFFSSFSRRDYSNL